MQEIQEIQVRSLGGEDPLRREWHPTPVFLPGESHAERARSRLISEAKQGRAWLVLGWETAWEYRVL